MSGVPRDFPSNNGRYGLGAPDKTMWVPMLLGKQQVWSCWATPLRKSGSEIGGWCFSLLFLLEEKSQVDILNPKGCTGLRVDGALGDVEAKLKRTRWVPHGQQNCNELPVEPRKDCL